MSSRLLLTLMCAAAELFAFVRLMQAHAHREYRWFVIYLLAGVCQSFIWLAGEPSSNGYMTAYALTTPFVLALQALVVLELWKNLMHKDSGAEAISRTLGWAILAFAFAVSMGTGFDSLSMVDPDMRRRLFHLLFWGVRYSASVLCVISSVLAVWAMIFSDDRRRNLSRHAQLLAGYFGSVAIGYLIINFWRGSAPWVGAVTTGAAAAFYTVWGIIIPHTTEPVSTTPSVAEPAQAPIADRA